MSFEIPLAGESGCSLLQLFAYFALAFCLPAWHPPIGFEGDSKAAFVAIMPDAPFPARRKPTIPMLGRKWDDQFREH